MEVLKHGNRYKEIECLKCGALLSYCNSDIRGYWKGRSYTELIICPECNERIILKQINKDIM